MIAVTLGEVLLRLSPAQLLSEGGDFSACFGGGEANVASALSGFGIPVRHLGVLPENDLGAAAEADLKKCGIDTRFLLKRKGRMGLYFYEAGASLRAGKVLYDRKDSAFACTAHTEYPLPEAMSGASWLHLSGITPALGEKAERLASAALREAKERGLVTSFDVNYRPSLWALEEAAEVFQKELMPFADVCIVSSHGCDVLGVENGGLDVAECERAARQIQEKFGCKTVALTLRRSLSASVNELSGVLLHGDVFACSPVFRVDVLERVGGGDAFSAGLIFALMKGFAPQEAVGFAAAAEAYKHTVRGDKMCVPAEEIFALLSGDTRVRR